MKKLFIIFFLAILLLPMGAASALEITDYPPIPGYTSPKDCTKNCFYAYGAYLFGFFIYIAGALALISFTIGAIGYLISLDNEETRSKSKDRMKGAVYGLILTFASFIILKTINPQIIEEETVVLPTPEPIEIVAQPGVYYYLGDDCTGAGTGPLNASESRISTEYAGKIKSVKIINKPDDGIFYGVIFHKTPGLENGGECNEPLIGDSVGDELLVAMGDIEDSETSEFCPPVPHPENTFAADIFRINADQGSSGDGVTFYSEAHGDASGQVGGRLEIADSQIKFPDPTPTVRQAGSEDATNGMKFIYTNVSSNDPEQKKCPTFQKCAGSILLKGRYLIGIYSNIANGKLYCQTFRPQDKGLENLKSQPIRAPGSGVADLNKVYIIPITW